MALSVTTEAFLAAGYYANTPCFSCILIFAFKVFCSPTGKNLRRILALIP